MAVIKDFNTPYGVDANYHKLLKATVDGYNSLVEIEVAVYHSETARQENKQPLTVKKVTIPFWRFKSDPRQAFYNVLQIAPDSYLKDGTPSYTGEINLPDSLVPKSMEQIIAETPPLPPVRPTV